MKEYLPDALNLGPIGLALWGVAAASLAAGLTFGAAWAIIRGLSAAVRLYRKLAGPLLSIKSDGQCSFHQPAARSILRRKSKPKHPLVTSLRMLAGSKEEPAPWRAFLNSQSCRIGSFCHVIAKSHDKPLGGKEISA
jgi:hypothetical protein